MKEKGMGHGTVKCLQFLYYQKETRSLVSFSKSGLVISTVPRILYKGRFCDMYICTDSSVGFPTPWGERCDFGSEH